MIREIIEKCNKKKKSEADGGYGDLGVIPTAPNPKVKDKDVEDKMIVDGEVKKQDVE